jgi:DNA-binding LacI/PurR family transcriptional regulator
MTLKDLASIAGVSVSAVSKALNNSTDVSSETRERVLALAQMHGYAKKSRRKAARKDGPLTIAIIYSDITSNYYTKLIEAFDMRISDMGGILVTSSARFQSERIVRLCQFYEQSGMVDGIICISPFNVFGEIGAPDLPMVGISYPSREYHAFDYLCVDDAVGIAEAVTTFQRLGHTRIAYLGEKYTWYRRQSFEEAMQRNKLGVDPRLVIISEERFEQAGYDTARRLLQIGELPTAILAAYDDVAFGAAQVLMDAGFRIPDDISVAGIDNTLRALHNNQVLGSVNCHIDDQVEIALNLLQRKINSSGPPPFKT